MAKKVSGMLAEIFALICSVFMLVPFYMILINSFKSKEEAALVNLSLPDQWHIVANYTEMFREGGLGLAFRNSALLTVPSVLVIILVSSLAAFVLQRRVTKASKRLLMLILMGLFIPGQIIPTYFICYYIHVRTFLAAGLVLIASNLSMGVFLYTGYFKSIPRDLD